MVLQRPNCIVSAVRPLQRPLLQSSIVSGYPLSPASTQIFPRQRQKELSTSSQRCATEMAEVQEKTANVLTAAPARIVPVSPAYFSGSPKFTDNVLYLERMVAKYANLPTVRPVDAPRMAWFKWEQLCNHINEWMPAKKYKILIKLLQRLNQIDRNLVPEEVHNTLNSFLRPGNPYAFKPAPRVVDEMGWARATGKRKEATAIVSLVEGEGEVLINGRTLADMFPRIHHRESAAWPLRCTQRLDKYNVWATVKGGGVTGQAEALTLALARALLIHEPGLKPTLRSGMFTGPVPLSLWIWGITIISSKFLVQDADNKILQLVLLRSTHVVLRGRSQAISRHARCLPGSNDERSSSNFFFFFF